MKNNRYTIKFKRRRQGKTNYKKRLQLLQSRKPRLTIRKTNQQTIVQVIKYEPDGDKIISAASTRQLLGLGWKHNSGNVPAAYLAGYAAGLRAVKAGVTEAIADLGSQNAHAGGRLFAAVKGAQDAGLNIPVDESVLPDDARVHGSHINESLAKDIDAVKKKVGA